MWQDDVKDIKRIWHTNSVCQNISWMLNVLVFLIIMPYYLIKEYFFPGKDIE